jgi:hypothetical protein
MLSCFDRGSLRVIKLSLGRTFFDRSRALSISSLICYFGRPRLAACTAHAMSARCISPPYFGSRWNSVRGGTESSFEVGREVVHGARSAPDLSASDFTSPRNSCAAL